MIIPYGDDDEHFDLDFLLDRHSKVKLPLLITKHKRSITSVMSCLCKSGN